MVNVFDKKKEMQSLIYATGEVGCSWWRALPTGEWQSQNKQVSFMPGHSASSL